MRTERPTPWGFDIWDPRLDLRRAAADAQQGVVVPEPVDDDDPAIPDETTLADWPELEAVGAGGRDVR